MEGFISAAGDFGKYQKIVTAVTIAIGSIPFCLTIPYSALTKLPAFLCKNENGEYTSCEFNKETFCTGKVDFIKDKKNSVDNFAYDLDLYCDREFFISIYSSLFFLGAMLSTVLMAPIPDKYGRKLVFQILQVCLCIILFNNLFVFSPWQLAFLYFSSGFCSYAYGMSSVIIAEYLPRNIANIIMTICNGSFSAVGVIVGIYFNIFNNKFFYLFIIFFAQAVFSYLTVRYFKESVIWLFSLKLKKRFVTTLTEIAELNGKLPEFKAYLDSNKENLDSLLDSKKNSKENNNNNEEEEVPTITLRQIYGFKSQRGNMIRCFITFFITGLTFYGIILNLAYTKHNFFITCYCCFFGEITGEFSSGVIANLIGRIKVTSFGCFIGGICFISYTFIDSALLSYISIFCATYGFAATFNVIAIYAPELFPTPIRAKLYSYCFLMSRFGAMVVGPITNLFGVRTTNVLFFASSIFSGLIFTNMEETLGKPLKNEIPELEGVDNLIAKTGKALRGDFYASQNVFTKSFIGFDPVTIELMRRNMSTRDLKPYNQFQFSGIFSQK